jgi:hypothetical protein
MMFVRDDPVPVNLLEPDRQPKVQLDGFTAGLDSGASHESGCERDIGTGGDVHLGNVELHRLERPRKEHIPRPVVRINAFRLEWRRHIEHQDVVGMIQQNRWDIFSSDCRCPCLDEITDCRFVVSFLISTQSTPPQNGFNGTSRLVGC